MIAQLIETPEKCTDLDPRILDAYIQQCTAEAQEGWSCYVIALCVSRNRIVKFVNSGAWVVKSFDLWTKRMLGEIKSSILG